MGRLADGMLLSCCDNNPEALSHGAAGFIPKSARKSDLAAAIRSVMDGAVYIPEDYGGQPLDPDSTDRAHMCSAWPG